MLRSDSSDYSDAYIVVKGTIDLLAAASNGSDKAEENVAFKNYPQFISCISKINSTLIGNAEDHDKVIPMYNLLEYSQNYGMNYYRGKTGIINDNASDGKSFKYKTKIVRKYGKSFKYKTKIVGKTTAWSGDQQCHL